MHCGLAFHCVLLMFYSHVAITLHILLHYYCSSCVAMLLFLHCSSCVKNILLLCSHYCTIFLVLLQCSSIVALFFLRCPCCSSCATFVVALVLPLLLFFRYCITLFMLCCYFCIIALLSLVLLIDTDALPSP
jgi:hypothetical protein